MNKSRPLWVVKTLVLLAQVSAIQMLTHKKSCLIPILVCLTQIPIQASIDEQLIWPQRILPPTLLTKSTGLVHTKDLF